MTTTYSQIIKQIQTLQRQAETARMQEVAGVVSRIKEAIAFYSLTAADLGFTSRDARLPVVKNGLSHSVAKFGDSAGNTWGGRGPRPGWLTAAIDGGKLLSDFALGHPPLSSGKAATRKKSPAKGRKIAAKYRDAQGNTWAGRGLQPRWFKAALAEGKTPESLLA